MRLQNITIKNFRSIKDANIDVDNITRIIGANGAGKSSILKALELFYASPVPPLTADDFFNRDTTQDIEITLKYHKLNEREKSRFQSQIKVDGTLAVTRLLTVNSKSSGVYYGSALRCPAFAEVRAIGNLTEKKKHYNEEVRCNYPELKTVTSGNEIEAKLQAWEAEHLDKCVVSRDDGQFFGYKNVAHGRLDDCTTLVYIPAVRDASDDVMDGKNTPASRLLEWVVKREIESRKDFREFKQNVDEKFMQLMHPDNMQELGSLANELTNTLKDFYDSTAVELDWQPPQPLSLKFPYADMSLNDEGFVSSVDRTGHGLQRALIITLLQHLAMVSRTPVATDSPTETDDFTPSLILAIEEPELYQHPTKQRHFCEVLSKLASGLAPGVARDTQVIFTTHSPIFVSMQDFEQVRLVRRQKADTANSRRCEIVTADLERVAKELARAQGSGESSFSAATLKPRLHVINDAVAEGFFSGVVVLVEGPSDRAALLAAASDYVGKKLEELDVAVISVEGKSVLDKPYLILRELGVPTFVIWDCDKNKNEDSSVKSNRALQRLVGIREEKISDHPEMVGDNFACFENNLECTLKGELGDDFWNIQLGELAKKYGLKNAEIQKNPRIMAMLFEQARNEKKESVTIRTIIESILRLKTGMKKPSTPDTAYAVEGEPIAEPAL